jgi:hypothetical protein
VPIDVNAPLLHGWTRMQPPTIALPFWSETDDGTRHDLQTLLADARPEVRARVVEAHIDSISTLLRVASDLDPIADFAERRRIVSAASRLCAEVAGWGFAGAAQAGR